MRCKSLDGLETYMIWINSQLMNITPLSKKKKKKQESLFGSADPDDLPISGPSITTRTVNQKMWGEGSLLTFSLQRNG